MKTIRTILSTLLFVLATAGLNAQTVNGVVLFDTLNLKALKVWGTHQERGYAYGYLLAQDVHVMITSYIKPVLGSSYVNARNLVTAGNDLSIDSKYHTEAQGIIDGMNAVGYNPGNLDATDILVGNCLLDLMKLLGMKSSMGCSSLMDWGDATVGTPLNGKSVITRHLDWTSNATLLNNQLMVVHQPSEAGEQPWIMIGFAGMMSALSGVNATLGTFQHVMDDFTGATAHNMHFKPVWLAMRDALEYDDYNADGSCNVQDVKSAMNASSNGFADGFIISALAASSPVDSLVAMVAELTPAAPAHTYRYNSFADSIPGDNLYTANYQIGRNNMMHFCNRYNGIRNHIGNGTMIGIPENWVIMRDWSHQSNNIQCIQFAPEANHLQISVKKTLPAYQQDSLVFDLSQLLNQQVGIAETPASSGIQVYPNPATVQLKVTVPMQQMSGGFTLQVTDFLGRTVLTQIYPDSIPVAIVNISGLKPGLYNVRLAGNEQVYSLPFVKK
jgi:hypothetical protein